MKLESLSIIFIIIVLPISMILSQYVERKVNVAKTELQYDTRLLNSTYDAIKTYQLNTINNSFGDVTNSKIQDIEAAVSSFQNSLANNFGYTGSRASIMKQYVPAIAFTLYDGYYVYSPFYNTLTDLDTSNVDESYSKPESYTDGLKPYVYYSCRYVRDNDDFIITYSLDNYITIQGKIKGSYHYDYGYLYSIASNKNENGIYYDESNNQCYYNGIQFNDYSNNSYDTEELKEFIGNTEYSYAKINGKKYYLEHSSNSMYETITVDNGGINLTIDTNAKFFYLNSKGEKIYAQVGSFQNDKENFIKYYFAITHNKSAFVYYKNAYMFTKAVLGTMTDYKDKAGKTVAGGGYGLTDLKTSNAYIYENSASDTTSIKEYGDFKIFSGNDIEYAKSNFNKHRKSIIRYVVETNLSAAISGFSSKAGSNFLMPKISESDWDIVENNVCAISFLQGINIGSKKYNGYSVVANTLTKEYVDENDIYILAMDDATSTPYYCRVNDEFIREQGNRILPLPSASSNATFYPGSWKINFEQKLDLTTGTLNSYIPTCYKRGTTVSAFIGSYTSIIGSSGLKDTIIGNAKYPDIYTYLIQDEKAKNNLNLKKTYYYALGRERWGAFDINNVNFELNGSNDIKYFLDDYKL